MYEKVFGGSPCMRRITLYDKDHPLWQGSPSMTRITQYDMDHPVWQGSPRMTRITLHHTDHRVQKHVGLLLVRLGSLGTLLNIMDNQIIIICIISPPTSALTRFLGRTYEHTRHDVHYFDNRKSCLSYTSFQVFRGKELTENKVKTIIWCGHYMCTFECTKESI